MRLNRLLPGLTLMGVIWLSLPAYAARLQFWRFDSESNRLTFTTNDSIQPTAQLLANPTRLVIDLPGTTLIAPETQTYDGAIKEIRVSELDAETTRLVVEYHPGYSVDPALVQVRGENARQWSVQLPDATEPDAAESVATSEGGSSRRVVSAGSRGSQSTANQRSGGQSGDEDRPSVLSRVSNRDSSNASSRSNSVSNRPVQGAQTRIQGVTATADGFFVRTAGDAPEVAVDRQEEDGQRLITLTFEQTAVALGVTQSRLPDNRYSVERWQVDQVSADPATAQITLALAEESPDWDISANADGVVILPKDMPISRVPDRDRSGSEALAQRPGATVASAARLPAATRQVDSGDLPTLPEGRYTVVIDPGHGGRDPGAVGIGSLQEKDVVNDIAPQVASILRRQGVNVVMTRESDVEVDLEPRVAIAERARASAFVSIHANAISMSRPDVNGLETFYASDAGQRFATTVHNTIVDMMGIRDRSIRSARFYVIRETSMPAILIETGFVTGAEDAPNLANPEWRSRMAEAIAKGILIHLQRGL